MTAAEGPYDVSRQQRVSELLGLVSVPDVSDHVVLEGDEPVLPFRFPYAEAAATVLAACGGACAWLWANLTGRWQTASVDLREAAMALDAYRRLDIIDANGASPIPSPVRDALSGPVQAGDERWIQLNGSQYHFRDATLKVLAATLDDVSVRQAARAWTAFGIEDRLASLGVPAAVYRTAEEWSVHPQGSLLTSTPLVEIERVSDSPVESYGPDRGSLERPLSAIRSIDLSRVLAGPTAVKLLAAMGSEAIRLTRPGAFEERAVMTDTGFGKRSAWMDLDRPDHLQTLHSLVRDADVLVENTRFGGMARRGVGVDAMTTLRPGLIYASLNCYGHTGPWRERRGYEPHGDAVAGLRTAEDPRIEPDPFFRTIADYTSGWLAALGILGALYRRSVEGGSYHVRVSLARTAMWVRSFPTVDPVLATGVGDVEPFMVLTETPFGLLRHCRPPLRLSETPTRWELPPCPFGTHRAEWGPQPTT